MSPALDQLIALTTWPLIFVIPLVIAIFIFLLRENHSTEVYVVWYFFALFFVVFSFLSAYAWKNNKTVNDIFGQFAWGEWVYNELTDWNAEVWLVLVFLGLVLLPQWLAYLLSGLSRSASPPLFVLQATDMATWSLIKTLASLSGIKLAGFLWAQGKLDLSQLFEAEILLFFSFALFVYRYVLFRGAVEKLRRWHRAHVISIYKSAVHRLSSLHLPFLTLPFTLFDLPPRKERWYVRTILKMRSYMRKLHLYFTKYRKTTSTTPTALEQARSSASEALTTAIVQVLQDSRVKSEISIQVSGASDALVQALRDAAPTIIEQARSSASEALKTIIAQAVQDAATILDQPSSPAFEALMTLIAQAVQHARVNVSPDEYARRSTSG
jgi:hypothetical protein